MDIDDLYGLPLDRFVPERTALSRALRTEGRREDAAAVAALTKPSVAAWAVNQLVRTQKRELAALLAAGDALREAQERVVAGRGDGRALRAAAEAERSAVAALIEAGRGLLTSNGHELSTPILERVAETLRAAALDDQARARVSEGRLERELRHVGFGPGSASPPAPPVRRTAAKRGATATKGQRAGPKPDAKRAERERGERERAERERARALTAARAAAAQAHRRAERALQVARERRERAAQALAEAEDALSAAETEAQAAAGTHARAEENMRE